MYLKSNERFIVPIYRNFIRVLYIFIGGSLGPYVFMYDS